ncbi:MAG: esterase family protein [Bacteroidales bacterium]|nr:esterase family protein [Bacteroidales bacterium]
MKRIIIVLCLALLVPALSASAGRVVTDSIKSTVLDAEVKYNVYLPDSFAADSQKTYPVVYLLHGLSDDYTAWVSLGGMQTVADELIGTGEACEMVIIMPNAGGRPTNDVWNGYFNMPGWNYEDFFFGEFIPEVEAKYRAGGSKPQRAIMGLSMGGGGSVVYSQRHPDMFSSCYAMSAWLDNRSDEVWPLDSPKDCLYYVANAVREHSALDFIDNADAATLEALRTVAWFIDCGDDDFIFDLSVALHQKMRDHGVHSEFRVRNGIHNWEYWHISLRWSLPFATRNFGR